MQVVSITYNDPGISWGPAIHFLELWNAVARLHPRLEVHGYAPSWTGHRPILPLQFKLTQFPVPDISKGRQVFYDLKIALRVLIPARRDDVLYVRLSQFHLFSTIVLQLRRNPVILELNGLLLDDAVSAGRSWLNRAFVRWQEGALVKRADGLISVSQGITDTITRTHRPRGKIITLKNGVGMQFFDDGGPDPTEGAAPPASTGRPAILYVGTFTPWDGAARIVELARHFPQVDFHFVGDGPARKAVQGQATPNMFFHGRVEYPDLPRFYRSADAGIVLYETQRHQRVHLSSLKTLEYLASGLPVFTTNVPGQELVADLGCGVLSDESRLLQNFEVFLDQLPKFRASAQAARSTVRRDHSWERVALHTVELIHTLTDGAPDPHGPAAETP